MLIKEFELNHQGKLPAPDVLKACDPKLKTWRKLFARRCTRHSESLDVVDVNETVYNKFAESNPGNSIVPGFFPSVRISP